DPMKKATAIYLRVSSSGQDVASQEPDLRVWLSGHRRGSSVYWYRDRFTGATLERPGMRKLEHDIQSGKVETLVVWRRDRLGMAPGQTITFLDGLRDAGVRFVSLRDGVDTSTATGRLMRTIIAGFAEYEREVISERIRAGIARARAKGKRWGGKKPGQRYRLTKEKIATVSDLLSAGKKKAAIARQLGVSRSSVYRAAEILSQA